jgi:hypothetical protein
MQQESAPASPTYISLTPKAAGSPRFQASTTRRPFSVNSMTKV